MTINYTTLLGLAQPVTGTEQGTWGDTVNTEITALLEDAIADAATFSVTSGDVTLTSTAGQANQARMAILLVTGTPGVSRNIIAPSQSKWYIVKNSSDASVVLKGSATTGVTILAGTEALCFWNGSDFEIVGVNGPSSSTDNAVVRFDGTTGKVIQNSGVIIDDSNNVSGMGTLGVGAITTTGVFTATAGTVSAPAITTTGDLNTGIFFPAADTIAFAEGGAEAMRIDSSGNVGIGTSSPAANTRLNVASSGETKINMTTTGTGSGTRIFLNNQNGYDLEILSSGDASGVNNLGLASNSQTGVGANYILSGTKLAIGTYNNYETIFGTNNAERMRIDSSGNVGIGTSSPSTKLDVVGDLRVGGSSVSQSLITVGGGSTNAAVNLRGSPGSAYAWQISTNAFVASALEFTRSTAIGGTTFSTPSMLIDSSGNVGIGTTSPTFKLEVTGATGTNGDAIRNVCFTDTASAATGVGGGIAFGGNYDGTSSFVDDFAGIQGFKENSTAGNYAGALRFTTRTNGGTPTERARITSAGDFLVGKTTTALGTAGTRIDNAGGGYFTADGGVPLQINRLTNDGDLVLFYQATTQEGSISVSGTTVSYNAFAGSHWSQLQQGRGYNPDILRGTVMSTIGEMCEWKSVVWDEVIEHPAVPAVEAKEAVLDEEGNVIEPAVDAVEGKDAWTETVPHREAYLGQLPVGATFEEDGVTKTVVDDGNERLPKVKISDVVGDKAVYGVFQTWDEVQDMLVTSLGAFVVRIASGVTVQIGDLLESNGDGCAKVQDDDVIRSKTIGKVTSITPSATYADGSYTVPAVLYCG